MKPAQLGGSAAVVTAAAQLLGAGAQTSVCLGVVVPGLVHGLMTVGGLRGLLRAAWTGRAG